MSLRPVLLFFLLAYLISWLLWLPLYGPALGISGLPVARYQHALGAYGPMLAGLYTVWFMDRGQLRERMQRLFSLRSWPYLLLAGLGPFALGLLAIALMWLYKGAIIVPQSLLQSAEFPGWHFSTIVLYNLLTFGLGEEAGWRGYALPRLANRLGTRKTIVLLTLLWAGWHLPLFLYRPGYMHMDMAGVTGWLFSLLTGSILLSWLFYSSKGSLWPCILLHACMDIVFMAPFGNNTMSQLLGMLITICGMTVAVVYLFRHMRERTVTKIITRADHRK